MTFIGDLIDRWRETREDAWWAEWSRIHRWDELADYNSRVAKGIVHTPEYVERMRQEQVAFNREQEQRSDPRYIRVES